jgi:hypothetical protein
MTFKEYYQHYLTLHQHPMNRYLHFIGQLTTITYIVSVIAIGWWWGIIGAPFVVYPFAWAGHFFYEKNKPAAFSNPLWAKACDWIMFKDILTGKLR